MAAQRSQLKGFLGGSWKSRIIRVAFIIGAVLTVVTLTLIPFSMKASNDAQELLSSGERATAHSAEGQARVRTVHRSDGPDRRKTMDPEVRATVDFPNGSQLVQLNDPESSPESAYNHNWAPAPAPYDGTFEVAYDPADVESTVIAVTDLEEAARYTPRGNFILAGLCGVWTLIWLVPFLRTFRKA